MVKTTTAPMDAHLAGNVTSLATAVVIERTDGVKFRLTTSSEDIEIDIGDGDGVQSYSASEGVSRTNIQNDAELNVDNLDVVGVFDNALLREDELRRGLFDFADFKIFVFNHRDISQGIIKIFRGQLGEVIVTPLGFFKVTVRSIVQVYSKETSEHYSKDCRADLGDARCGFNVASVTITATVATVSGTEPRRTFTTTGLGPLATFPNDWFNLGAVTWITGNNAGRALEVRDFIGGDVSQTVEVFQDLPFDVQVGDQFTIFPGCDKTLATCISKFNNAINFVGEPFVPGEDILGQYPDAR